LTRYSSRREAGSAIESMLDWFCALNGKSAHDFEFRLQELERRSRFQERTRRFMAAAARTRCDFTNLGGIDVELCNIVGYHPQFRLSDLPQAQVNAAELANRREM
jgi:hypothetical protein